MRSTFAFSLLSIVIATSTLVSPGSSHTLPLARHDELITRSNNSQQTASESIVAKEVRLDSIPQRVLGVSSRIPHAASLREKPLNAALPSTSRCQRSGRTNGKGCNTQEHIVFVQTYVPTLMTTKKIKYRREATPEEVVDWNKNLKIHGLWLHNSKVPKSTLPFTEEARAAIKQEDWPITFRDDIAVDSYSKEWQIHGVESGFKPLEFIHEINRLHQLHKTPNIITETSVPLAKLKSSFGINACLACRSTQGTKFLMRVYYCHQVNPSTRKAGTIVPFANCGACAPEMECNQETIMIPKLKISEVSEKTNKPDVGKEYTVFSQSYLPTMTLTGQKKYRRDVDADDVDDWNNNLKIHGLWPKKFKVAKSTLPFTEEAIAAVDKKAWLTMRGSKQEICVYEWETHGVETGLRPLQFVHEINRLHKFHSTPDILKGSTTKTIMLDELKHAFNENACLLCRRKKTAELFIEVNFCHEVNSETRQIGQVVPFENCGFCSIYSACTHKEIIIPKIEMNDDETDATTKNHIRPINRGQRKYGKGIHP